MPGMCSYSYTLSRTSTSCKIKRIDNITGATREMSDKKINELDGSVIRYYPKLEANNVYCVFRQKIVLGVVVSEDGPIFSEGQTVGPFNEDCR